jgi:hypothetical protein
MAVQDISVSEHWVASLCLNKRQKRKELEDQKATTRMATDLHKQEGGRAAQNLLSSPAACEKKRENAVQCNFHTPWPHLADACGRLP